VVRDEINKISTICQSKQVFHCRRCIFGGVPLIIANFIDLKNPLLYFFLKSARLSVIVAIRRGGSMILKLFGGLIGERAAFDSSVGNYIGILL
jgi:hypothetical protein